MAMIGKGAEGGLTLGLGPSRVPPRDQVAGMAVTASSGVTLRSPMTSRRPSGRRR